MKNITKALYCILLLFTGLISLTSCVEHRYYRTHHHHSPDYYHRHHQPPPPGVDIDIHN